MKKIFYFFSFIVLTLLLTACSGKHGLMPDHMAGTTAVDERAELKLPAPMKIKQKAMMRKHLNTVSEITKALAENDLTKAGEISKSLGWSPEEEKKCSAVSNKTGEPDFLTLGMALHTKADQLAAAAEAGDRDKALLHLSELIVNCNNCHYRFRH